MTTLPPIPEAAIEAAWDAHVNGNGVATDVMEAAHPHIVIATLRWAADLVIPVDAAAWLEQQAERFESKL